MSADEIFEKLGYVKVIDENHIYYNNLKWEYTIVFDLLSKTFIGYIDEDTEASLSVDMQELKAINQKCKELGWLQEEN